MSGDGLSDNCHAHNSIPCTPWCHPPIEHMHFIFYFYHVTIFAENVSQFIIGHIHGCIIYSHFDYGCLWVILEFNMATFADIVAVHELHFSLWWPSVFWCSSSHNSCLSSLFSADLLMSLSLNFKTWVSSMISEWNFPPLASCSLELQYCNLSWIFQFLSLTAVWRVSHTSPAILMSSDPRWKGTIWEKHSQSTAPTLSAIFNLLADC